MFWCLAKAVRCRSSSPSVSDAFLAVAYVAIARYLNRDLEVLHEHPEGLHDFRLQLHR